MDHFRQLELCRASLRIAESSLTDAKECFEKALKNRDQSKMDLDEALTEARVWEELIRKHETTLESLRDRSLKINTESHNIPHFHRTVKSISAEEIIEVSNLGRPPEAAVMRALEIIKKFVDVFGGEGRDRMEEVRNLDLQTKLANDSKWAELRELFSIDVRDRIEAISVETIARDGNQHAMRAMRKLFGMLDASAISLASVRSLYSWCQSIVECAVSVRGSKWLHRQIESMESKRSELYKDFELPTKEKLRLCRAKLDVTTAAHDDALACLYDSKTTWEAAVQAVSKATALASESYQQCTEVSAAPSSPKKVKTLASELATPTTPTKMKTAAAGLGSPTSPSRVEAAAAGIISRFHRAKNSATERSNEYKRKEWKKKCSALWEQVREYSARENLSLVELFRIFDANESGYVESSEMLVALEKIGMENFGSELVKYAMSWADSSGQNGEARLDYHAFTRGFKGETMAPETPGESTFESVEEEKELEVKLYDVAAQAVMTQVVRPQDKVKNACFDHRGDIINSFQDVHEEDVEVGMPQVPCARGKVEETLSVVAGTSIDLEDRGKGGKKQQNHELHEEDVRAVMAQVPCARAEAEETLSIHGGDIVSAIIDLEDRGEDLKKQHTAQGDQKHLGTIKASRPMTEKNESRDIKTNAVGLLSDTETPNRTFEASAAVKTVVQSEECGNRTQGLPMEKTIQSTIKETRAGVVPGLPISGAAAAAAVNLEAPSCARRDENKNLDSGTKWTAAKKESQNTCTVEVSNIVQDESSSRLSLGLGRSSSLRTSLLLLGIVTGLGSCVTYALTQHDRKVRARLLSIWLASSRARGILRWPCPQGILR